jgi:hypothetical protein
MKLDDLQSKVFRTEDAYRDACEKRNEFIAPVIEIIFGFRPSIENVYIGEKFIEVDYGWSCGGRYSSESLKFPKAIMETKDPITEAKLFKQNNNC